MVLHIALSERVHQQYGITGERQVKEFWFQINFLTRQKQRNQKQYNIIMILSSQINAGIKFYTN